MRGLFDRLRTGSRRVDDVASIVEHLRVLLNSRSGTAPSAPGFGSIDLVDRVHHLPDAHRTLERSIADAIERHEPRLTRVRVTQVPCADPLRLELRIEARLAAAPTRAIALSTHIGSSGRFEID